MADRWEQLELFLVPSIAMRRGDQVVWCCRWCGTVVINSGVVDARKRPGVCPGCDHEGKWFKESLPVASDLGRPSCPSCSPSLAGFSRPSS